MQLNYNKKIISIFVLFFLANILFFLLTRRDNVFENGVYIKYFESMFNDHDFNIFNQFTNPFDQWMATVTYNHPDYHSPFISSILLIPYLFSSLFTFLIPFDLTNMVYSSHLFFTVILFALVILAGYQKENDKLTSYKEWFYLLIFSTGSLWFSLFVPTELSGICLIFTLIIFFELYNFWKGKSESVFTLSLALGYFSILKPDGIFYALAICGIFLYQRNWKKTFPILIVLALCQSQVIIVNYIRYGGFLTKNPAITFDHNYILDYLIGPNGLFIKNPVHILLIAIMVYRCFTSPLLREKYLMSLGLIVIAMKAVMVGFVVTPITDYVANRHAIAELPFFAYALFSSFKDKKTLGRTLLGIFIVWNIYDLYGCILNDTELNYPYVVKMAVPLSYALSSFHYVTEFLRSNITYFVKNQSMIFILSLQSATFLTFAYFLHLKFKHNFRNIFLGLLIFITCSFTFVDIANNKKHTALMKQTSIFNQTVIAKDDAIYYDETLAMIAHLKIISHFYHKPEMSYIDQFEKNYLYSIQNDIIYDPTTFRHDLEQNKIRPSYWELKMPKASVLEKKSL